MATAVRAAKHICLGVSRFNVLVAEGVIERQKPGQYNLDVVREAYCLHAQKMMAGRGEDGGKSLSAQRTKLAAAQTQAAEFKNAQLQGGFVEIEVFKKQLITDLMGLRERALSTPGKMSDSLTPHCAEDRERIFQVLKSEVYEMLEDMSDPTAYAEKRVAEQVANRKKESR
jgi:hypothetical protein